MFEYLNIECLIFGTFFFNINVLNLELLMFDYLNILILIEKVTLKSFSLFIKILFISRK